MKAIFVALTLVLIASGICIADDSFVVRVGPGCPDPLYLVVFKLPDGNYTGFWKQDTGEWLPMCRTIMIN